MQAIPKRGFEPAAFERAGYHARMMRFSSLPRSGAVGRQVAALIAVASLLTGCQSLFGPPVSAPRPSPQSGTAQPSPQTPTPPGQSPAPVPPPPGPPAAPKEFHLSAASAALVKQG